jgi:hypothetical protein
MLRARLTARVTDMPLDVLALVGSHLTAVDEARAACVCRVFRDTFVSTRAAIRAELARVLTVAVQGGRVEQFASECVRAIGWGGSVGGWATWLVVGDLLDRRVSLWMDPYRVPPNILLLPKLTGRVALGPVRFFNTTTSSRGTIYHLGVWPLGNPKSLSPHPPSQHAMKYMLTMSKTLTL